MFSKGFSTNYELLDYSKKLNIQLTGIIYKDELLKIKPPLYGSFILNLDETGAGGSHWVAFFSPKNSSYSYYFDSYGIYPPESVKKYSSSLKKKDIIFNTKQIQSFRSNFCGQYSLVFLYFMQKEKGTYNQRFEKFLKLFQKYNLRLI
jgi:hypothetical protein